MKDKYFLRFSRILSYHPYICKIDHVQNYYGKYIARYLQGIIHKTDNDIKDYDNALYCIKTYKHIPIFTYGEKNEITNWKYYCTHNKLPLFSAIVINYNQHNNNYTFTPWITDKRYSDEEIYKKLKFTAEEIDLIESTIEKYDLRNQWYKRLHEGKEWEKYCNE